MGVGFDLSGIGDGDIQTVNEINAVIIRLSERRKTEIRIVAPLDRSKLAWKIAVYQQAVLYRIVMLATGVAQSWNFGNLLTSILAARAFVETTAVLQDFESQLSALLGTEDLIAIDYLVMNRTFASCDAIMLEHNPKHQAINILTFIDRLDENGLTGIRAYYDMLSERCHPNSMGHHQMFSRTDRSTGAVTFSERKHAKDMLQNLLASVNLALIVERTMDRLDSAILATADLQHRLNPVAG